MGEVLSEYEIKELMKEGYSIEDIRSAMREVEREDLQAEYGQSVNPSSPTSMQYAGQPVNSAFGFAQQDNLIKWQLELDNILERIEHILRGDILFSENGKTGWKKNPDHTQWILNEYGVNEIMRVLSSYLNRNTILSDYTEEEIREKVLDFGLEMNDLIFTKYEEMGLIVTLEETFHKLFNIADRLIVDNKGGYYAEVQNRNGTIFQLQLTKEQVESLTIEQKKLSLEKRKNYPILLREIVDIVHSSYKRALEGGERRSLREARSVTQTEPLNMAYAMGGGNSGGGNTVSQRNIFNPLRYILGSNK